MKRERQEEMGKNNGERKEGGRESAKGNTVL
jgi:hypothetical protein